MRINTVDTLTKKALTDTDIMLQIKGKDSGYLAITTDENGMFTLDESFKGQQISALTKSGTLGAWISVADGITLMVGPVNAGTSVEDKKSEMLK